MSMFTVTGQLINVLSAIDRVNEAGEVVTGRSRIQLLGYVPQPAGGVRYELLTVSVDDRSRFAQLKGRTIRLPIGVFAPAKGQVVFFVPKGARPEVVDSGKDAA